MTEPGRHASSARRVAGARIAGVVSCVPSRILTNAEFVRQFGEDSVRDVVKMIGVETQTDWAAVMATTVLALLPPVVVVLLMQRWFVAGLTEGEK